jgi:hypothetical protein
MLNSQWKGVTSCYWPWNGRSNPKPTLPQNRVRVKAVINRQLPSVADVAEHVQARALPESAPWPLEQR